jgi:RNA polymerase sigma-70 factor (ECF subfamily)
MRSNGRVPPPDADRDHHPATEVARDHVLEALGHLSPDHRQILLECHFRGRTVTEAAQSLSLPATTVKSRIYYALRSFHIALAEASP